MGVLETYNFEQLVNIFYPEEEADAFMGNLHRGAFAKAVCGDEYEFVDPKSLTDEQKEKARKYFEQKCAQRLTMA